MAGSVALVPIAEFHVPLVTVPVVVMDEEPASGDFPLTIDCNAEISLLFASLGCAWTMPRVRSNVATICFMVLMLRFGVYFRLC